MDTNVVLWFSQESTIIIFRRVECVQMVTISQQRLVEAEGEGGSPGFGVVGQ